MRDLRVVALCCDGLFQRDLTTRLHEAFDLRAIVLHRTANAKGSLPSRLARYLNPVTAFRYLATQTLLPAFERKARPVIEEMFYRGGAPPEHPGSVPVLHTVDVNAPEVVELVRDTAPDVVCVNGTNLLRRPMLELIPDIPLGIVNLHTGVSPYSRGGNCNLFMLLEGRPELVGITIHYIDAGIDSGDIVITARPELAPGMTFEEIEAKVFRLGNEKMVEAVRRIESGVADRIPQWEEGKLFLKRTGYRYEPHQRLRVNRMLREGLIEDYLADRVARDAGVRLIG